MDTSLFSGSGWNIVLSLGNVGHLGKLSGHDPYAYLEDLLTRLTSLRNSAIHELLPCN
jgi:predicted alpha/beta hydrolase family esterase